MLKAAPTPTKTPGVPRRASEEEAPKAPMLSCPWVWPLVSDLWGLMGDKAGNLVSCRQPHTPLSSRPSSSASQSHEQCPGLGCTSHGPSSSTTALGDRVTGTGRCPGDSPSPNGCCAPQPQAGGGWKRWGPPARSLPSARSLSSGTDAACTWPSLPAKVAHPELPCPSAAPLGAHPPLPRGCPGLETGRLGDLLPEHNGSTPTAVRCPPPHPPAAARGLGGLRSGGREHLGRFGSSPGGQGIGSVRGEQLFHSFSKSLGFPWDFSVPLLGVSQP